jgi:hypothetical protein
MTLTLTLSRKEAVSQRLKTGLSSRTNVRDLRFLPVVEMTEGPTDTMFPVLRHTVSSGARGTDWTCLLGSLQ